MTDRSVRLRGDRGSSMMLMPVAVLIVIILGGIAADFSHVHNRKRELISVANSIANDAVTYGIDIDAMRGPVDPNDPTPDDLEFSDTRAGTVINESIAKHHDLGDRPIVLEGFVINRAENTVTVNLTETVDYIFAGAVPGAPDSQVIRASGSAVAIQQ